MVVQNPHFSQLIEAVHKRNRRYMDISITQLHYLKKKKNACYKKKYRIFDIYPAFSVKKMKRNKKGRRKYSKP